MSIIHQIALTLIKSVGSVTAKKLLDRFGSAEAIFAADEQQLLEVEGIGRLTVSHILSKSAMAPAAEQLELISKYKIKTLFYTDDNYPQRLKNCYDAPVLLYYRGAANLNHPRIVSIVGTRNATAHGRMLCKQLIEALKPYDVLVISGLAYGIDIASHEQSLINNIPTVGVLAHGLDRIYPAVHHQTAVAMVASGGLLTEFPFNTIPVPGNFPRRNRIIAGISDVTVVVEAAMKGGALITADIANSYNRDVFAYPGRTTDEYGQGCNFLIKTSRAALLSQAKDLVYYMGWETVKPIDTQVELLLPPDLSEPELKIVELLKPSRLRIDELTAKSGIQSHKIALHLLNLEIKGVVISTPGMVYQLL